MANALAVTLRTSAETEATSGNGDTVDFGASRRAAALELVVTETTGDLSVYIQASLDGADWRDVGSFPKTRTKGRTKRCFDRIERYVRIRWTLAAESAATFSLSGKAHTVFAEREDLQTALPPGGLDRVDPQIIAACLIKASSEVEDAFARTRSGGLTEWSESVTEKCADLAAYKIVKQRGFQGGGVDEFVKDAYDHAQLWLRRISDGRMNPPGVTPDTNLGVKTSSGNPDAPTTYAPRMSDNWGDF